MDLDLLVDTLFYMIIGFLVAHVIIRVINKYLEAKLKILQEVHEKVNTLIRAVRVEHHGDQTYWFDAENDTFIAQGRTRDEIVEVLKARWSKHIFLLSDDELIAGPDFHSIKVSFVKTDAGYRLSNDI